MSEHVIPYKDSEEEKKKQVAEMFDNIAHKYDFLNHFLSLNIDKSWRKKSINLLQNRRPKKILDVATGTGDLALESYKRLDPELIIGIDISKGMLEKGKDKISKAGLEDRIQLEEGDSENITFPDQSFDAVTVAFGVRNFENLQKGLKEMYRVLKPDGEAVILEFSRPEKFPVKQLYRFYFKRILPAIGKLFSKDMSAYSYLPESVDAFPYGERFAQLLNESGFRQVHTRQFTFGIAMVYHAKK
jgi:demethylmenaquinone methyltransferase/2-methoxy-6-polyprenyl-1,4-benzoquinol methylase